MRQLSLRGTDGARTHDLPHVKRTLIPAELRFHIMFPPKRTVEPTGLECEANAHPS